MKGHRARLFVHLSVALLAVSVLAGPANAQSGLGTRLDEAGQKLDSDMQSCRPVNLAEYALLLNEAMANKQRATKAAKKGVPVNQAQVDSDLAKASMLFARAQAAQAMQCMRAAQQQAQPQPQAQTPQSTGMAPSNASITPPQGLSPTDQAAIARQQITIDQFEKDLAELESLVKAGKCREAWDLVDDLDDWLDELDTPVRAASLTSAAYRPSVPGRLIDEWDDRIDELIKNCRPPGMLDYKQVRAILDIHNSERAQYGLEPLRWSPKLALHAQDYVGELKRAGQMTHAPREGRGAERENISQGLPWWSVQQHLESWRQEKKKFKPGIFPDVSFTGNWYEVGHWTQWIWARTVAIGCAMAVGGPASWLVCRYWPGGNKDGQPVGIPPAKVVQVERRPPTPGGIPSELASTPNLFGYDGTILQPRGGQGGSNNTSADSSVRPRPVGGDYGHEPQSLDFGSSEGGPIEYVRITTFWGPFDPYRYYSGPLVSFESVAAGAKAAAPAQPAINPLSSAFSQWAGNTLGQSSSVYGSDSIAAPSPATPKYGFDVTFGGGPDGDGNWQTGFHGFYSFGETPQTIYVDTNVTPPTLSVPEAFAPVPPNTPLDIM